VSELETRGDGVWRERSGGVADTRVTTHERSDSELSATEGRRVDFDVTHERRRDESGDDLSQVRDVVVRQGAYPC